MELLLQQLCQGSKALAQQRNVKTITASHLKGYIMSDAQMDFLKETVAEVEDMKEPKAAPKKRARATTSSGAEPGSSAKPKKPRAPRKPKAKPGADGGTEAQHTPAPPTPMSQPLQPPPDGTPSAADEGGWHAVTPGSAGNTPGCGAAAVAHREYSTAASQEDGAAAGTCGAGHPPPNGGTPQPFGQAYGALQPGEVQHQQQQQQQLGAGAGLQRMQSFAESSGELPAAVAGGSHPFQALQRGASFAESAGARGGPGGPTMVAQGSFNSRGAAVATPGAWEGDGLAAGGASTQSAQELPYQAFESAPCAPMASGTVGVYPGAGMASEPGGGAPAPLPAPAMAPGPEEDDYDEESE